jgi:hypothetical protein
MLNWIPIAGKIGVQRSKDVEQEGDIADGRKGDGKAHDR